MTRITKAPTPVPWDFTDNPALKLWVWTTPHFEVKIFGEGNERKLFNWMITDRSKGRDVPYEDGVAQTFREAQDTILEIIGKGYPQRYGYLDYAGPLATTYQLANGDRFDFAQLLGQTVILHYENNEGEIVTLMGILSLDRWLIQVRVDNHTIVKIPSIRIHDIQYEFQRVSLIGNPEMTMRSGRRRGRPAPQIR